MRRKAAARRRGTKRPKQADMENNLTAAKLILSDEARHGGPDSLMVRWAYVAIRGREQDQLELSREAS